MNVTLAENLFSSNLNFIELDSLSVSSAKDRFHEFQRAGVIKDNCTFDDNKWYTTNEYANIGLYFDFNRFSYRKYEPVFQLSLESFTDYVKAYCISIFGKNVLVSIENTLLDIKHLLNKDYEDICGEMSDLRLYSVNRLSDFLSLLVTDDNADEMERLISALDSYADIKYGSNKGFNQRELADFDSYFEFDDIIKDYWNSDKSPEDRFFYYPLYIWWVLTAVIPLRPREFLLTERDCIYKDNDDRYNLKLRRNQLKGGTNGELSYKISDAYLTQPIPIPDYLGKTIEEYINETDKYEHTDIDTLFVTDPHYRKWGQRKHSDSRFLTYMNMNTILKYFYKEIIHEKYGYTIRYDNEEVDHENKEIRYIHLGDTRHIAFINLMQEGATPVTAMLLGGHTNIEMAIARGAVDIVNFVHAFRKAVKAADMRYTVSYRAIERLASLRSVFDVKKAISLAIVRGMAIDDLRIIAKNINVYIAIFDAFDELPFMYYRLLLFCFNALFGSEHIQKCYDGDHTQTNDRQSRCISSLRLAACRLKKVSINVHCHYFRLFTRAASCQNLYGVKQLHGV